MDVTSTLSLDWLKIFMTSSQQHVTSASGNVHRKFGSIPSMHRRDMTRRVIFHKRIKKNEVDYLWSTKPFFNVTVLKSIWLSACICSAADCIVLTRFARSFCAVHNFKGRVRLRIICNYRLHSFLQR